MRPIRGMCCSPYVDLTMSMAPSSSPARYRTGKSLTGLSVWSQFKPLLASRRRALGALTIGSVLAGLTESGILAVLAQSAAALVNGTPRVHIVLGPVHVTEGLGVLLAIAIGLALARLALQAVISIAPAQIAADARAHLSHE